MKILTRKIKELHDKIGERKYNLVERVNEVGVLKSTCKKNLEVIDNDVSSLHEAIERTLHGEMSSEEQMAELCLLQERLDEIEVCFLPMIRKIVLVYEIPLGNSLQMGD